jgi:hypothetical protein
LAYKGLIREQEAGEAKVEILHSELVKFSIGWATFEITGERFEIKTSQEPYFEPVRDLCLSIFEILRETPVRAMGINHINHYSLPREDVFFEFGNKLAPLNAWSTLLQKPRVSLFEIFEEKRRDEYTGNYRIRVRPSDQKLQFGIQIEVNDHYEVPKESYGRNAELMTILKSNWTNSLNFVETITEGLWKHITN